MLIFYNVINFNAANYQGNSNQDSKGNHNKNERLVLLAWFHTVVIGVNKKATDYRKPVASGGTINRTLEGPLNGGDMLYDYYRRE